jgi:hypothetical protein
MASHNKTPMSVLTAPGKTYEFVEGTEFNGQNRAESRRFAQPEGHALKSMSQRGKPEHWVVKVRREALEEAKRNAE